MTHSRLSARMRTPDRVLLAGALVLGCAAVAHAQQPTGAQPRASLIEEITVTAQRREESVQDVPIAVSAFSGAMLEDRQIISPSDLQMNAPNVSYTDTNFGGSSLSIRGIGNLVTAGSGDAGVSVHINEIAMPTNLPAAEFYDMERVEILRGPQGTLFGRNATGGVLNMVTARPHFDGIDGHLDLEIGDYSHRRVKGALNLPLTDTFAIRAAGMWLERDGYIKNLAHRDGVPGVKSDLDGRDLYSIRLTAQWDMNERASAWFMYSRFKEDDDKVRITNQICSRTELPTNGCDADAFGFDGAHTGSTTGGLFAMLAGALPMGAGSEAQGLEFDFPRPELGLRTMHTDFQPEYKFTEDIFAGGFEYQFDNFTVGIIGGYRESDYLSRQDYTMQVGPRLMPTTQFAVVPNDQALVPTASGFGVGMVNVTEYPTSDISRGLFDPNCNIFEGTAGLPGGCALAGAPTDRVFAYDQGDSESEYWTIELKVRSDLDGPFNFQIGANHSELESSGNYYVVANTLDLVTSYGSPALGFPPLYPGFFDSHSSGPGYEFESQSIFGEVYFDLTERLKLTAGLRYNRDKKEVRDAGYLYNSLDFNAPGIFGGALGPDPVYGRTALAGYVFAGSVALDQAAQDLLDFHGVLDAALAVDQSPAGTFDRLGIVTTQVPIVPTTGEARVLTNSPSKNTFTATTGRIGLDWQVTDHSMVYGFYSRGYKPGGFNPPVNPEFQATTPFTFDNEKVDAFEVGSKNVLLNGTMILNAAAFLYDYSGLQIAKIENNTAVNDNVDADVWGAEVELFWRPEAAPNLALDASYSWLRTKVSGGTRLLDPVDRAQGDPSLIQLKNIDPGSNTGINYVANLADVAQVTQDAIAANGAVNLPGIANYDDPTGTNPDGIPAYFSRDFLEEMFDQGIIGNAPSDGVLADIGGNKLPNSPEHTIRLGAAYTFNLNRGALTARWDYYWQAKSYGREYNRAGDRISSWDQHNASLMFETLDGRWALRGFIRNVFDKDNVTGHYLTSDTSGLFRNYFLTEPRIYGASVRLAF